MLDLLPKELIIEILRYLSAKTLLALTETSKLFNEIISESLHLSSHFELLLVPDNQHLKWSKYRKYSKVFLDGSAAKFYLNILSDISDYVREIKIECKTMNGADLKDVLLTCKHLKCISIEYNKICYKNEDFEEPLPQLHLHKLHYHNYSYPTDEIFKMLINCQIISLNIVNIFPSYENLRNFIKNQKDMQSLGIKNVDKNLSLFSTELLDSVDFRLKKLKLTDFHDESKGLENFILNHRDSLHEVDLTNVQQGFLKILQNFPNAKKFKIFSTFFKPSLSTVMLNVEELTIGSQVCGSWAVNFPNVRQLEVTWDQPENDLIQIKELKKLEKLEIVLCLIPELSIPSVKCLKLVGIAMSDERPFKFENNQIEELIIESCSCAEWIVEYLTSYAEKLKILKLKELKLNKKCWNVIDKCSENFNLQVQKFSSTFLGSDDESEDDDE